MTRRWIHGMMLLSVLVPSDASPQYSIAHRFWLAASRMYQEWKPLVDKVIEQEGPKPGFGDRTTKSFDQRAKAVDRALNAIPREPPSYPTEVYEMTPESCQLTRRSQATLEEIEKDRSVTTDTLQFFDDTRTAMLRVQAFCNRGVSAVCAVYTDIIEHTVCTEFIIKCVSDVPDAIQTTWTGTERLEKRLAILERELQRREEGKQDCERRAAEARDRDRNNLGADLTGRWACDFHTDEQEGHGHSRANWELHRSADGRFTGTEQAELRITLKPGYAFRPGAPGPVRRASRSLTISVSGDQVAVTEPGCVPGEWKYCPTDMFTLAGEEMHVISRATPTGGRVYGSCRKQ